MMTADSRYNHATKQFHPAIVAAGSVYIATNVSFPLPSMAVDYAFEAINKLTAQMVGTLGEFQLMEEKGRG